MELEQQIKLVDELIAQKMDRTIKDFIRTRGELEKYSPALQRIAINAIKEPTTTIRNND